MKFALTEEQQYIQKAVRDFTKGEFDSDQILDLLQKKSFPRKMLKKACQLDFVGVCFPEDCGGQDYGCMEHVLIIEELCRRDSAAGIALSMVDVGAELICRFGSAEQQQTYLRPVTKGKMVLSVVVPDLEGGLFRGAANVVDPVDDGTYRVSGQNERLWNADLADVLIVPGQPAQKPSAAPVFMLVARDSTGVTVTDMGDKLGMGLVGWHHVALDNVAVSEAQLLHIDAGPGYGLIEFQKSYLLRLSAVFLGIAQGAFDIALAYARQREQFKQKIAEFQGIRHKLADMYTRLQEARALCYAVAGACDQGGIDRHDAAAAALVAEEASLYLTDEALQIYGGAGYMIEVPVEHFYRDARMLQALTGRKCFQKDVIADAIIGKIS